MPKVDAHQHFWHYELPEFSWLSDDMAAIRRDFLPPDLAPSLAAAGYAGTVAVQARSTTLETAFLLGLADGAAEILGVVGWVDLCAPDLHDQLAEWAPHPKFVGVRENAQGQPAGFLDRPEFRRGVRHLASMGLTYDILIYADQLVEARRFAEKVEVPMVLDHCAKPRVCDGQWEPWASDIRALAMVPHVWCKVSGLAFEARWDTWDADTLRPYVEHVLECFGPKRCMIGSDWPVCVPAGDYGRTVGALETCLSALTPQDRQRVLGANAVQFYGLSVG